MLRAVFRTPLHSLLHQGIVHKPLYSKMNLCRGERAGSLPYRLSTVKGAHEVFLLLLLHEGRFNWAWLHMSIQASR